MFCLPYHSICPPETLINKICPQTPSICIGHYTHAHTLTSFFQLLILFLSLSFLQLLSTLSFSSSSSSSSSSSPFSRLHNQTFITKPFKDHIFWSLETRFKHYNLHFLKNTRALIFSIRNRQHYHLGEVFFIFFSPSKQVLLIH